MHYHHFHQHQHRRNLQYGSGFRVQVGDIVIFSCSSEEAKSNYDIGVVTQMYSREQYEEQQHHRLRSGVSNSADKEESELRQVLRLATSEECERLPSKHVEEEKMLASCKRYAESVFRLPMDVYGCEFQFDGGVVTLYYSSEERMCDYRELVRTMSKVSKIKKIRMRKMSQQSRRRFAAGECASAVLCLRCGIVDVSRQLLIHSYINV